MRDEQYRQLSRPAVPLGKTSRGPLAWGGASRGCVAASKTARQLLLPATDGIHAGKGKEVYHPEISGDLTAPGRKRRLPLRLDRQEGMPVEPQQPNDDFAHHATADRPQMQAVFQDLGFLQDIVPKRRRRIEILVKSLELAQVLPGQDWHVHGFGDALAGWELPGDVTEQVPLRRGSATGEPMVSLRGEG